MGVSVFDVTYAHHGSNGNSCSITLKPSLILVSGLSGHFQLMELICTCTNGQRDSGMKFTSPDFCFPFIQTIN